MPAFVSPRQAAATVGTRLLDLLPHQALRLDRPARLRLRVRRGELWITVDGEARDVVLQPGDCFAFADRTPAVISAFGDGAEFEVRRLPAPGGRIDWLLDALARLFGAGAAVRMPAPVRGGC